MMHKLVRMVWCISHTLVVVVVVDSDCVLHVRPSIDHTTGPAPVVAAPYAPGTPLALMLTSSKVLAEQTHKLVTQCVANAGLPMTCALVHGSSGAARQLKVR